MSQDAQRTPLSALMANVTPQGDAFAASISEDWLQGRAVYGGLSAALCLQATLEQFDDLPPLRSVQMTFVGPAGSAVEIRPTLVRRGKSTAFVTVDLFSNDKLAVRAAFCFGADRQSQLSIRDLPMPEVASPDACESFFEGRGRERVAPNFTQHFNSRHAAGAVPVTDAEKPDFTVWLQHRDDAAHAGVVGLVALADALPPAAMACFAEPAPISTMTWMFDILTDAPDTDDGWWLCRSAAESTAAGYSSQRMQMWNTAGEPIIAGRQNVAIFY